MCDCEDGNCVSREQREKRLKCENDAFMAFRCLAELVKGDVCRAGKLSALFAKVGLLEAGVEASRESVIKILFGDC